MGTSTDAAQSYTIKYVVNFTHCMMLLMNTICSSFSDNQRMGVLSEQILYLWSKARWLYLAGYDRVSTAVGREGKNPQCQDVGTEVSGRRS